MPLTKYKLGELIELVDERNYDNQLGKDSVVGLGTQKEIIPTKADLDGVSLTSYKLFPSNSFAYVPDTSRRGDKISLARNAERKTFLVSSISIVFKVRREDILLPDYLFMYFNRPEFDRYARFHSWGSAREAFSWAEMCDVEINLPSLLVQKKFVAVYNALLENKKAYERGLEDLKLVCDGYIENLRRNMPCEKLGKYIRAVNEKNENHAVKLFQGVNVDHVFTEPKRIAEDAENGNIVRTGQFAFNKVMKAKGTKLPIALREGADCVVSNSYEVFEISDKRKLLPEYLMLWLNREETQRYAGFISFGTTRDIFSFADMCEVEIPIPDMKIQRSIAAIYEVLRTRKKILERLKEQIKDICPILIKGSLDEGAAI
ncbi:MAG: restriction endonuclease subunit S [Selenomonadaceae bacterium]|nr:restriction endonuclease subunit S [Selenomonadaceae bacterium]